MKEGDFSEEFKRKLKFKIESHEGTIGSMKAKIEEIQDKMPAQDKIISGIMNDEEMNAYLSEFERVSEITNQMVKLTGRLHIDIYKMAIGLDDQYAIQHTKEVLEIFLKKTESVKSSEDAIVQKILDKIKREEEQ